MKLIEQIPTIPYQCRFAPTKQEFRGLFQFLNTLNKPTKNLLEFGCGVSSWFLYHGLEPKLHVATETFEQSIQHVNKYLPNIKVLQHFENIPNLQYDYIFLDSAAGYDGPKPIPEKKFSYRDKSIIYAQDNDIIPNNAILIVHDFGKMNRFPKGSLRNSYNLLQPPIWQLIKIIPVQRQFGVYQYNKPND